MRLTDDSTDNACIVSKEKNMKRILYNIALPCILLVAACEQKEEFDGARPDVRLAELLAEYGAQLTGAGNGWLGYLFPEGGGGYTFKFTFGEDNRVVMYADMNGTYATTPKESSYRLKATQVPTLYFDTYSYIHELSDPDPARSGGTVGQGLVSDFEFSILSVSADTLRLKGNLNGSELLLVRASSMQGNDYIARAFAYNQEIDDLNRFPHYHNRFSVAGREYNFTVNSDRNTVSFYSSVNGFARFTTEYAVADNGLVLRTPFVDGDLVIAALTDFDIDSTAATATVWAGQQTATITNQSFPLAVDPDAARRMYIEAYTYTSDRGFTIGGEPDALGMADIPGYLGINYIPRRFVNGYDGFMVRFNGGADTLTAVLNTRLESDGRMSFYNYGGLSTGSRLPGGEYDVTIDNFLGQLIGNSGYYVYQTGRNYYDLVSVADGRRWIRFY